MIPPIFKMHAPAGFFYAFHSMQIGALNDLVQLQLAKTLIVYHLDWASEAMFQVYHDSRVVLLPALELFFGHLR